jgi:hypothetical protein
MSGGTNGPACAIACAFDCLAVSVHRTSDAKKDMLTLAEQRADFPNFQQRRLHLLLPEYLCKCVLLWPRRWQSA